MQISAKSMEWQLKNEKGTLRRDVKVKLIGFDLGNRDSMKAASRDLGGTISAAPTPQPEASSKPDSSLGLGEEEKKSEGPSIFDPTPSSAPSSPGMPGLPSLPGGSGAGEKTEPDSLF